MMKRREFIKSTSALAALSVVRPAQSADTERLSMPELIDARAGGRFRLQARRAVHQFGSGLNGDTMGFSADYLGPVIRVGPGQTEAVIDNGIDETITTHWHGLLIPGEVDGGPHQPIPPGKTWRAVLPITQEPATTWYHSHVHGDTGRQVYHGLAGVLQISDGRDDERGLPASYGEDDLTLIVQDKRFERGQLVYEPFMPDIMHGFLGNMIMVNGQVGRQAVVPPGIVRLRLLNASNARILQFSLASGRPMHLIATDSGMLPNPLELSSVRLATGERAEILIDLARVQDDTLIAHTVANSPMMGGMMGGRASPAVRGQAITVLPMVVDASRKARQSRLPVDLGGSTPPTDTGDAQRDEFTLEMGMMGGMGRGMMGRGGMGP
ncbi:MAG: multicopper oxidase domain-containing protein, partial [Bdellovibrionales bacterium]|nr:multicopper oxidase domain-containing protein [Bdellovibrionales bacterium]